MLSTKNLNEIPDIPTLQKRCKSIAAIEAIICPDWQYRYYSYNNAWSEKEEFCEMRDGSGDQMLILFSPKGVVINGFAHESVMSNKGWDDSEAREQGMWKGVVDAVPTEFHEFIFGEPVKSIGTTFCIWRMLDDATWKIGDIEFPDNQHGDGSADLLQLLDGDPETYRDWAEMYYEEEFEERDLDLELVRDVYEGKTITKELVLKINPDLEDFEQLWKDLGEIGYPFLV